MGINAAGVAKASPSAWSTQSITLNANLAPGIFQGAFPAPRTPNPTKCSLARATSRWDFPAGTLLPHVFISNRIPNKTPSQLEFLWQLCSRIPTRCSSPCPPRTQILLYHSQKVPGAFLGSCRSRTRQREPQNSRSLRVFRRGSCTQETWEQSFVPMVHLSLGISRCQNSRRHQGWLN